MRIKAGYIGSDQLLPAYNLKIEYAKKILLD